jgi:hypothetical protein
MAPDVRRVWAMPNKRTFSVPPIGEFVREEMAAVGGLWIDPFSCGCRMASVTNDLNPEVDADYHVDALEFMAMFDDGSVDGVLYDPPYSPRQVAECYRGVGREVTTETTQASFWARHKKEMARIVREGGKVLSFGWNSGGVGMKYGFEMTRVLLVAHGGAHHDTICTSEYKLPTRQAELPL